MSSNISIKNPHNDILEHLIDLHHKTALPHALLFTGPWGIGKHETAQELAKAVLGPTSTGADLYKLEPETAGGTYSIDQIRFMQKITSCTPYEGQSRVFIINDAHQLTIQATNAFLKLLEEPPPGNHFILVTAFGYKLLPTLASRLQKIKFLPKAPSDFKAQILENNLDVGSYEFMAEGSLGKACLVAKYKTALEGFEQLIPYSFIKEFASFHMMLEKLDEDKAFEFKEFFPLFEDLIRDFVHFNLGLKASAIVWPVAPKKLPYSLTKLSYELKQLEKAVASNMKLSSAFERFFINLSSR